MEGTGLGVFFSGRTETQFVSLKAKPAVKAAGKAESERRCWGKFKNVKLLHSFQLIFKPDSSGIVILDNVKSTGFHFNGKKVRA